MAASGKLYLKMKDGSFKAMCYGGGTTSGGSGSSFTTDFYGTLSGDFTHNSSGNYLKVPFDTATRDANSEFNATTDLWVCGTSGTYVISCILRWAANATGYRGMTVQVNGDTTYANHVAQWQVNNGASLAGRCAVCMPLSLSAADTVAIVGHQNSGGSLDVYSAGSYFCIWRIA